METSLCRTTNLSFSSIIGSTIGVLLTSLLIVTYLCSGDAIDELKFLLAEETQVGLLFVVVLDVVVLMLEFLVLMTVLEMLVLMAAMFQVAVGIVHGGEYEETPPIAALFRQLHVLRYLSTNVPSNLYDLLKDFG